jgi:hypothetical protein
VEPMAQLQGLRLRDHILGYVDGRLTQNRHENHLDPDSEACCGTDSATGQAAARWRQPRVGGGCEVASAEGLGCEADRLDGDGLSRGQPRVMGVRGGVGEVGVCEVESVMCARPSLPKVAMVCEVESAGWGAEESAWAVEATAVETGPGEVKSRGDHVQRT